MSFILLRNAHLHNYNFFNIKQPAAAFYSKTSSASNSTDTLVQDKGDEPARKKRKVYKFQRAWLKEFEWLEWGSEKELMRCRYCKAFPMHGSSSLVNGCDNFKHATLTKHSKSKSHKVLYFLRLGSKVDLKNVTVLVLSSTYSKSLKGTNTGLK